MAATSRWDRPPAPKDVRWAIRLFGKVLIVTGLLMFGFVAYQLWGTGIEYARAQDRLGDQFEDLLAARPSSTAAAPTSRPPTPTTAPATTAASTSTTEPAPTTTAGSTTTAAPTTTTTTTTSAPTTTVAPLLDFSYTADAPLGQLWIPTIGLEGVTVVQGVGREDLKEGPGHYPNTAFPGELGNAAIAGHRTTFGGPFRRLPELEVGDEIAVVTLNGTHTYRVTGSVVVNPDEGWVIQTTDPTVATLTLTTCTPLHTARQRYIVFAELVPELSDPVGRYVPRGADGTAALPGGDYPADSVTPSTTTSPTTSPSTTVGAATTSPTTLPATTPPSTTATPTTAVPATTTATTRPANDPYSVVVGGVADDGGPPGAAGPTGTSAGDTAFGDHWFDDSAAWPHVAAWGVITAAIAAGAYLLARRVRNGWIGLAVGAAPFLVTLYFFYQNVNRLLPAAI